MTRLESTDRLTKVLNRVLFKQRLLMFSAGLLATGTIVVGAAVVMSLVANVIVLPVWLKVLVLAVVGVGSLVLFGWYAVGRLFEGNIENVAVTLEEKYPDLKGRLIAAIQFSRMARNDGFSQDLIDLNERQALQKAEGVDFNKAMTFSPLLRTGRNLALAAVVAVLLLVFFPGLFSYSYEVFSNPTTVIAPPLAYQVKAIPGTTEWVKYRDIRIGAVVTGARIPDQALIYHRLADGRWQETEIDLDKVAHSPITFGDSLNIGLTLRQINKSFDYYVRVGRVGTEVYHVDVVDRPRVTDLKLSIFYPDYTGLEPTVIDENTGSFSAVVGSRVNIQATTNLPIETAELVLDDSSRINLAVTDRIATTSIQIEKSHSYYLRLKDHLGEENPDPIEYYITAVPDEYPSIDVLRPGFDVNLNDEMMLPLLVRIYDDFGFSSLVMKYSIHSQRGTSNENVAVLHFSERIKTEGEIEFNWDMDQLNLFPGDYAEYYFEVADNDRISGPKITESRHYVARLPSLEEIISQSEGESMKRIIRTEELLKSGKDISDRMKNVARKLQAQSDKKSEWQEQKELKSMLDKNQEMMNQVEDIAKQMDESVKQATDNSLMSREILEKLAQIQKLYEDIATPEMKEAQKKLMEALQKMDQNELKKAMENFEMSQEELLKRLERTLALLKKLQLEQKMEAMLRKVEQMAQEQEDINKSTDEASADKLPSISPREKSIQKSLEDLKKEVAELEQLIKEQEEAAPKEAHDFKKAVKETDADSDMQKMADALNQSQKPSASKEGKKALSKLLQMMDKMQQSLASMKSGDQEAIKRAMKAAIDDSNYLSNNQEELLKRAGEISPTSMVLREMAANQQDLKSACKGLANRIAELGKESPFVAAELQMLLDQTTKNMEMSITGFDEKKGFDATKYQRDAMSNLNKASIRLMESLEQQKQCDKGGTCSNPTQKLQSMCEQQNQLNQQTQSQCNNPGGQNQSQAGREALERLAGEQATIRKSVEELNQEFGDSRQILGRLDDISKEMKEIEEALASGDVNQETLDRQLKVYSRMMEASRSLYRRDFSEQRKSNSATTEAFFVPPTLSEELLDNRVNLEDRLRRYLGEDYPPQYEKQIKAYFKAILQYESGSGSSK